MHERLRLSQSELGEDRAQQWVEPHQRDEVDPRASVTKAIADALGVVRIICLGGRIRVSCSPSREPGGLPEPLDGWHDAHVTTSSVAYLYAAMEYFLHGHMPKMV